MKESNIVRSLVIAIAVFAISAPAIASSGAGDELSGKSVKVTYADLDLQKEAGVQVFYRRLKNASRQACGVSSRKAIGSLSRMADVQRCYRDALSAAIEKINNPKLSKIHES